MNNYDLDARNSIEESIMATAVAYANSQEIKDVFSNKIIKADYFRNPFCKEVFNVMDLIYKKNQLPTFENITINRSDKYKESLIEGTSEEDTYISYKLDLLNLSNKAVTKAKLDTDILLLKQFAIIDYWNRTADSILNSYWMNRDVFNVSDNIINSYNNLLEELTFKEVLKNDQNTESIKEKAIKKFLDKANGIDTTIKVGHSGVDEHMGGLAESELIVIGGRPGMGKTAFALTISKHASLILKRKGLYFTLEMTKEQLMMKYAVKELGIPYKDLKSYNVTEEQFKTLLSFYDYIESTPLDIIFETNLDNIVSMTLDNKPDYVVVDYLQLIKTTEKFQSREQQVAHISGKLKALSTQAKIPVIALAQLKRTAGRPTLMDLRESGSLEQDADTVIFPYRPAYDNPSAPNYEAGHIEFIIPKCRSAGPGLFYGFIDFNSYKFYDSQPKTLEEYKQLLKN